MATGTVYSTPARPLPRNSLSRGAFKFKKSPKHCSWKCTALIAVGIAVLLSVILCYCIGKAKERNKQRGPGNSSIHPSVYPSLLILHC